MKLSSGSIELSATDLTGYLNCRHLTELDLKVAKGELKKPKSRDPLLELLKERGIRHENEYIDRLVGQGHKAEKIDGVVVTPEAVARTVTAMKAGVDVIVQGALSHEGWVGRADVLLRVEAPSALGAWSYEPVDAKLSRETKAATIIQLCLYADLLTEIQGLAPEFFYVVAPWTDFQPQNYRFTDYGAYYRQAKAGLRKRIDAGVKDTQYPDPKPHCEICRWSVDCDQRRRADDHLCLVAGITKIQTNEFRDRGISTLKQLSEVALPLPWKPSRGSVQA
jgi:uncharacterized protein